MPAIVCCLCLLSCSKSKPEPAKELIQASTVMNGKPDSALVVLESIPTPEKMSEADYAYYCLLLTEARDKTYYSFTSDSTIRVALDYYEAAKDKRNLPKAYYFMGRVCHTLRNAPEAINYYLKAKGSLEKGSDYALEGRIYNMLGGLYVFLRFNNDAASAYQKAYEALSLAGDSISLPYIMRNIGRVYDASEKRDSAILYYDRAISFAAEVKNLNCAISSHAEVADIFLRKKNTGKAKEHIRASIMLQNSTKVNGQTALIAGRLYDATGQPDSARYYFNQSTQTDNIYTRAAAIRELGLLSEKEKKYEEMASYYHQYIAYKDSIELIERKDAVSDTEHFYNYQQVEKEKNRLQAENDRERLFNSRFYFSIALLLVLLAAYALHYRQKKEKQVWAKNRDLLYEKEQHRNSREGIEANLQEIQRLKDELEAGRDHLGQVSEELLRTKKELLEQENRKIELSIQRTDMQRKTLVESSVYKKLKKATPLETMSQETWIQFKEEMDSIYESFNDKLMLLYPLMSDMEVKVCYLTKGKFSISEMANLIPSAKTTICSVRSRLYKKIKGTSGRAEDLDRIILEND